MEGFLLSDEGEVLVHTNPELLNVEDAKQLAVQPDSEAGKANEQIKQKMISLESGFGEWIYEADGTAQFIAYAPIPSTEWSVAIMEEQSILAGVINAQRTKNAGKILPIFLIGTVAIWMIARELSSRIRTITEHLNILETGDFSKPVPEKLLKLKDELGAAGHSMAKMQQSVGAVLIVLKDSVAVMDYRANDLQEVSGNVQQVTEGIAASTNQMAIGVQEQSNDLVNILEVINEFGLKLENVIEQLETVEMNTQSVNKEVDHGNQNAKELRASVESVNQSFIGFTKKINELSDNIKEITASTQEIAGSAESMNETVRGVEVAAQSLKQVSDEFTQQVAKFTI